MLIVHIVDRHWTGCFVVTPIITVTPWCEDVTGLSLWIFMFLAVLPLQRLSCMVSFSSRRKSRDNTHAKHGTEHKSCQHINDDPTYKIVVLRSS